VFGDANGTLFNARGAPPPLGVGLWSSVVGRLQTLRGRDSVRVCDCRRACSPGCSSPRRGSVRLFWER
jgi:hypothetical protein